MRSFLRLLGLAALLASTPLAAQAQAEAGVTAAEAELLQLALDRGAELYRRDQAAWHVTDAMLEDVDDPGASGIRGWVITQEGEDLRVTFWRPEGAGFAGVYSARYTTRGSVRDRRELDGAEAMLSAAQLEQIAAVAAVSPGGLEQCANAPFNTVVLPGESAGAPLLVYLLTPQTRVDAIPLGGHYRFTVQDGEVIDQRQFMRSCFESPLSAEEGEQPVALVVTHLLDPVPTEIHVFSTLAARVPIYVMTTQNERVWTTEIVGGRPQFRLLQVESGEQ